MNLHARLKEINERLSEIRNASNEEIDVLKLEGYEKECDALQEERASVESKLKIASKTEVKPFVMEARKDNNEMLEKRGVDLKEKRTIVVSKDEILLPNHVDTQLAGVPYPEVSTLVDKVNVVNLNGGETYTKSFVKSTSIGGLTDEGKAYTTSEPTFDYCTVNKVKVTAYTEVTEELEKLPAIDYQREILKNIKTSIRKKISEQILKGAGTANTFTGIFSDKATALKDSNALEIKEITDTTLDDIIFAYGGDEEVEGGATLILNKSDLKAFANLRTKDGRKVHDVNYLANTIDGIPYIINSNCKALTDTATTAGEYCMAYGALENYELAIFSPIEVAKSADYKFKEGIVCYKSSVFTGGNVVGYNGFLRIKKQA